MLDFDTFSMAAAWIPALIGLISTVAGSLLNKQSAPDAPAPQKPKPQFIPPQAIDYSQFGGNQLEPQTRSGGYGLNPDSRLAAMENLRRMRPKYQQRQQQIYGGRGVA